MATNYEGFYHRPVSGDRLEEYSPDQNTSDKLCKTCKTTKLKLQVIAHQDTEMLTIQEDDKLSIFLKYRKLFVVYRHRDGALAVLKNAQFRQPKPPVISDGMDYRNFMEGVKMFFSYAVALSDWQSNVQPGMKLKRNDIVLIIAWLRGDHCIGITEQYKINEFPKRVLRSITKSRKFLKEGMMLRMRSLSTGEVLELYKTTKTVFGWQTKEGKHLSLGQFEELRQEGENPPPLPTKKILPSQYQLLSSPPNYENTTFRFPEPDTGSYEVSDIPPLTRGASEGADYKEIGTHNSLPQVVDIQAQVEGDHWFKGRMSREKAEQLLTDDGDYLFRFRSASSNSIVLSHRITRNRVDHLEVIKIMASNEQILHQGTLAIEEKILRFARSNGMRFQDDKPIRLGGGPKERNYSIFDSEYISSNPITFKTAFEQQAGEDAHYEEVDNPDDGYQEIVQLHGNEHVTPDLCETVADHLSEHKLDEFGRILRIPLNIRRPILERNDSVPERISRLMDVWRQRKGANATVKVLLDALKEVQFEEFTSLVEDMFEALQVRDNP